MSIAEFEIEYGGSQVTVIVDDYNPAEPMRVTGWGFGDAEPGLDECIDYHLLENGEVFEPLGSEREFFKNLIRTYLGEQNDGC